MHHTVQSTRTDSTCTALAQCLCHSAAALHGTRTALAQRLCHSAAALHGTRTALAQRLCHSAAALHGTRTALAQRLCHSTAALHGTRTALAQRLCHSTAALHGTRTALAQRLCHSAAALHGTRTALAQRLCHSAMHGTRTALAQEGGRQQIVVNRRHAGAVRLHSKFATPPEQVHIASMQVLCQCSTGVVEAVCRHRLHVPGQPQSTWGPRSLHLHSTCTAPAPQASFIRIKLPKEWGGSGWVGLRLWTPPSLLYTRPAAQHLRTIFTAHAKHQHRPGQSSCGWAVRTAPGPPLHSSGPAGDAGCPPRELHRRPQHRTAPQGPSHGAHPDPLGMARRATHRPATPPAQATRTPARRCLPPAGPLWDLGTR